MRIAAYTLLAVLNAFAADTPTVRFREHVIESKIPGGYAVLVTDVNGDKRPDIIGLSTRQPELPWYENPSWERRLIVEDMKALVNLAAHDLDGDGIPELALENEFSMVAANSPGHVWLMRHDGDPRRPWKPLTRIDALTTSHHVAWADIDGDGRKELINAPLIGPQALAPRYEDHVPLVFYRVPPQLDAGWKREVITDRLSGVLHRVRVVQWERGRREQLLTAGFDGITLHTANGKGDKLRWESKLLAKGHEEPAPRTGSSDVKLARLRNKRFLASVEPWHGNAVVVYTEDGGRWQRRVIYSELIEGHEVCTGDLNGDGRDDIAAGDRGRGKPASAHVFYSEDDAGMRWRHEVLDNMGMSASGCAVTDMNADGRPDIVMIGGATANIKLYENLGR